MSSKLVDTKEGLPLLTHTRAFFSSSYFAGFSLFSIDSTVLRMTKKILNQGRPEMAARGGGLTYSSMYRRAKQQRNE